MGWRTRITAMLGIGYPILQAGMGDVAMGELAAAVSASGGLGVIGALRLTPEHLEAEIRKLRSLTDKPFGVDLVLPPAQRDAPPPPSGVTYHAADPVLQQELLDVAYECAVPVLVCAMYLPDGAVAEAHARGSKVLAMIGKVRHAQRAAALGADAVIATGFEAGGHTGGIGQGALTPATVSAVDVPVIAAGGITDGRGIAAALALGAEGVWMGTRFVATQEAAAHALMKARYLELGEDQTVISRAVSGKPVRIAMNGFAREWEGRTPQPFPQQSYLIAEHGGHAASAIHGRVDSAPLAVGQGVGLVSDIPAAGELVHRLVSEANDALSTAATITRDERLDPQDDRHGPR